MPAIAEVTMPSEPGLPSPSSTVLTEQTRLQIPSNLDWIEPTVEYLKTKALLCGGCDESQAGRLLLALHEALTNSIVHGNLAVSSQLKEEDSDLFARQLAERSADPAYNARTVHIGVDYDGERCQWSLTDEGAGFDYENALSRPEPAPEDMWAASGRGILLMRAMIDEVRYESGGRRVLLTLRRAAVSEQRAHARHPLHHPIRVAPIRSDGSVDWDAAYDAVTQNFSQGGLGLIQSQLSRAERVLIAMDIDGETMYVPAQVRHCKPAQGNVLELGCQFVLPDEAAGGMRLEGQNLDEAMAKLLAYLHKPVSVIDERRQHQRVSYTEPIEITPPGKPTVHAIARDISRSGISLIATEPFSFEAVVIGLPTPQQPVLRVRAQVVRCAVITEGFFDVAARFLGLA